MNELQQTAISHINNILRDAEVAVYRAIASETTTGIDIQKELSVARESIKESLKWLVPLNEKDDKI